MKTSRHAITMKQRPYSNGWDLAGVPTRGTSCWRLVLNAISSPAIAVGRVEPTLAYPRHSSSATQGIGCYCV